MRAIGRHLSATEASKATTRRASSSASLLLGKSNKKAIQKKQKQNHVAVTVTPPLIHQHQHQLYRSQHCHRHRSFEISHREPAVPFRFMSSTTTNTSSTAQPSTSPTSSATSTSVESAGSGVIDISHKQSTAEERRLLNSFFLPELQHSYASASPLPAPLNYTAMYESSPNPSTSASSLSIDHDTSFSSSSSSSSASSSSSSSPLHRQGSNTQEQSHTDHTFSPLTYGKDRLIAPTLVITDVSMPVNLSTLRTSASYQITKQVSNYFAAVLEAEADINVEDVRLVVVDAKTLSTDRLFDVYMVFNDQQIAKQVDYLLKTKGVVVYDNTYFPTRPGNWPNGLPSLDPRRMSRTLTDAMYGADRGGTWEYTPPILAFERIPINNAGGRRRDADMIDTLSYAMKNNAQIPLEASAAFLRVPRDEKGDAMSRTRDMYVLFKDVASAQSAEIYFLNHPFESFASEHPPLRPTELTVSQKHRFRQGVIYNHSDHALMQTSMLFRGVDFPGGHAALREAIVKENQSLGGVLLASVPSAGTSTLQQTKSLFVQSLDALESVHKQDSRNMLDYIFSPQADVNNSSNPYHNHHRNKKNAHRHTSANHNNNNSVSSNNWYTDHTTASSKDVWLFFPNQKAMSKAKRALAQEGKQKGLKINSTIHRPDVACFDDLAKLDVLMDNSFRYFHLATASKHLKRKSQPAQLSIMRHLSDIFSGLDTRICMKELYANKASAASNQRASSAVKADGEGGEGERVGGRARKGQGKRNESPARAAGKTNIDNKKNKKNNDNNNDNNNETKKKKSPAAPLAKSTANDSTDVKSQSPSMSQLKQRAEGKESEGKATAQEEKPTESIFAAFASASPSSAVNVDTHNISSNSSVKDGQPDSEPVGEHAGGLDQDWPISTAEVTVGGGKEEGSLFAETVFTDPVIEEVEAEEASAAPSSPSPIAKAEAPVDTDRKQAAQRKRSAVSQATSAPASSTAEKSKKKAAPEVESKETEKKKVKMEKKENTKNTEKKEEEERKEVDVKAAEARVAAADVNWPVSTVKVDLSEHSSGSVFGEQVFAVEVEEEVEEQAPTSPSPAPTPAPASTSPSPLSRVEATIASAQKKVKEEKKVKKKEKAPAAKRTNKKAGSTKKDPTASTKAKNVKNAKNAKNAKNEKNEKNEKKKEAQNRKSTSSPTDAAAAEDTAATHASIETGVEGKVAGEQGLQKDMDWPVSTLEDTAGAAGSSVFGEAVFTVEAEGEGEGEVEEETVRVRVSAPPIRKVSAPVATPVEPTGRKAAVKRKRASGRPSKKDSETAPASASASSSKTKRSVKKDEKSKSGTDSAARAAGAGKKEGAKTKTGTGASKETAEGKGQGEEKQTTMQRQKEGSTPETDMDWPVSTLQDAVDPNSNVFGENLFATSTTETETVTETETEVKTETEVHDSAAAAASPASSTPSPPSPAAVRGERGGGRRAVKRKRTRGN